MAAKSDGFKDFVLDQLTDLRGVTARAMFGGYGLYHRSTFFGIIHKGHLYFKVTAATMLLHAAGLLMLTYATGPVVLVLSALVHGLGWGLRGPFISAMRSLIRTKRRS